MLGISEDSIKNHQLPIIMPLSTIIDSSVLIKSIHAHPLIQCITKKRPIFCWSWTCNKCDQRFEYSEPSFYCTFCDYDLCQKCFAEYKVNDII